METKNTNQETCGALAPLNGSADSWTDQKPSAPGYYWIRGDNQAIAVLQVEMWNGELQVYHGAKWRPISDDSYWQDARWSSAIYPPNAPHEPCGTETVKQPETRSE